MSKTVVVEDTTINVITVGIQGPEGPGTPTGGTIGQVLAKRSNADFDTAWETIAGTGTVTSVTYTGDGVLQSSTPSSAVTTSGTVAATLKTQVKNTALLGPASGVDTTPTFRAIIGTDLPNPSTSSLGGVQAVTQVSHQWIDSISSSGVPHLSQPAAGDILGLAASATTDTTNASNISSGTLPAGRLPAPTAVTLGGVESATAPSHQFMTGINTSGIPTFTQPAASDVSGLAASATTDTTNASNISSGTLPAGRLPNPSATTLGGVQSIAAVSHQFITSISTSGVPTLAQPTTSDISGLGTMATQAASSVTITGGAADGVTIGGTTPCQIQGYCPTNYQTGTSYTLVAGDSGKWVDLANASAITCTIPPHSSVPFGAEIEVTLYQSGAGQVTPTAGSGVTLHFYNSTTKISGQYAGAVLKQTSTQDTWRVVGNTA